MRLLDVFFVLFPALLTGGIVYALRHRGWPLCVLIVLAAFPVLYVATVFTTLIVLFQVFGIDLID